MARHFDESLPLLRVLAKLKDPRHFVAASQVNKEWHSVASTPRLWRTLDLSGQQQLADILIRLPRCQLYRQHLREVKLEFTAGVQNQHLAALQSFDLEFLNLNGCQEFTQAALVRLLSGLRNLRHLTLYWNLNVKDEVLWSLAASAPKLTHLSLSGCKHVTNAGLRALAGSCTALEHIDLTRCMNLTDHGLAFLAEQCRELRAVVLYACSQVTDSCLRAIATLPQLRRLDLCGGHQVTDQGLASLAACRELRTLNLTWCIQLTDQGVCPLAAGCPKLEVLSLHGILGVTDRTLEALSASCAPSLHTLDVNGCSGMRHKSRPELLNLLPRLRTFVVHS